MAIRMTVFVDEQRVPEEEELDADDETATHFLVEQDGVAIATARLLDKGAYSKIGRVAVSKVARGTGAGAALMRFIEAHAQSRGAREVVLDAQVQALGFYEKLGYWAEGEEFLDAGIPHYRMRKHL